MPHGDEQCPRDGSSREPIAPDVGSEVTTDTRDMDRRRLLECLGAVGAMGLAAVSGCTDNGGQSGDQGEGDSIEVVVTNETDDPVLLAVRVEDSDGNPMFSHVYEIAPGTTDESTADNAIDSRPTTVRVFTPGGTSRRWEYDPDGDVNCDGQDIGIRWRDDGTIESYYSC